MTLPEHVRVAIIGTGFSGLGMAIRLRQAGIRDLVMLERADDLGGTWRDNTYPGCRCDVPSHLYSFSFAPNPDWSRTFSGQDEIWRYLRAVAEEYGLEGDIRYGHEVTSAAWDADSGRWQIDTSRGSLTSDVLISGAGLLSDPATPALAGIERFAGTTFHSARWDHEHVLAGERIAVVGTGASAIQFVPQIAPLAGRLHVFQRTAPWIVRHGDRAVSQLERRLYRSVRPAQMVARGAIYAGRETSVLAFMHPRLMRVAEMLATRHLHKQVIDPRLRERLKPQFTFGCKRILISDDWYPALQRPNVELVTDEIAEVREHSIVTRDGIEREVDTIIYGTGFHVTDTPMGDVIKGRGGRTLAEVWDGSPKAYNGTSIAGFPNFFMLLGPNTGIGHTSAVYMIESQVAYIVQALRHMSGAGVLEVRQQAQDSYVNDLQSQLGSSVWNAGGCRSWYLDRNGRNSVLWPGPTWRFRARLRRFDAEQYEIASRDAAPVAAPSA